MPSQYPPRSVMVSFHVPTGVSPQHRTVENVQPLNPALELEHAPVRQIYQGLMFPKHYNLRIVK
ncbi:hypothetical protein DPMN_078133 [Dreissena polymorpha]|uniref:Uncharacterized protein n=1 Tax=Dreissena polymorpha TaxID=45954 RepID=A0A9D3YQL9_DREPO|nr:hypothetical protein DPMN_078133 [Dreissena polymorpha]